MPSPRIGWCWSRYEIISRARISEAMKNEVAGKRTQGCGDNESEQVKGT